MKPTISVRTKQRVFSGSRAELTIVIDAADETKVDAIRAQLEGSQGWTLGAGKSRVTTDLKYPEKIAFSLQRGETVLKAGSRTEFQIAFDVPAIVPPSHNLTPAWAYLEIFVHVSIPWRIDVRQRFHLDVHRPPPNEVPRVAFAVRSNSASAPAGEPRIELGVPSRQVVAGEVLNGTVAVFHVDDSKDRDVELSLIPLIDTFGRRQRQGIASRVFTTSVTIPAGHAGRSVPFQLRLPKEMTATFETITHALRWVLNGRARMGVLRRDLQVEAPLLVHDATAARIAAPLADAPRVGDERIARLFATFASENGWRGADPEATDKDGDGKTDDLPGQFAIEEELDHSTLRIAYDYRGEHGTFLMAGIQHPFLGLALAVSPSSTVRHLMWRDIEVDIAPWDRAHHVVARDEHQTLPFLKQVVPALMRVRAAGDLHHWNDHGIWWEQPVARLDDNLLANIAADLNAVSYRIHQALADVAPPQDITAEMAPLIALAERYKAVLCRGDLTLWRTVGGDPVHTELVRDEHGVPRAMKFWFGDEDLASDGLREKNLHFATLGEVLGKDVPTELIEVLTGSPHRLTDFAIERGVARATLALAAPATVDATTVREVVDVLRASLAAVVPSSGPYR